MKILRQVAKTASWAIASLSVGIIAGVVASFLFTPSIDDWTVTRDYWAPETVDVQPVLSRVIQLPDPTPYPYTLQEDDLGWFCGNAGNHLCELDNGAWAR